MTLKGTTCLDVVAYKKNENENYDHKEDHK
jgi:hypothetical protein